MGDETRIDRAEEAVAALAEAYRQAGGECEDLRAKVRMLEERIAELERSAPARQAAWSAAIAAYDRAWIEAAADVDDERQGR